MSAIHNVKDPTEALLFYFNTLIYRRLSRDAKQGWFSIIYDEHLKYHGNLVLNSPLSNKYFYTTFNPIMLTLLPLIYRKTIQSI